MKRNEEKYIYIYIMNISKRLFLRMCFGIRRVFILNGKKKPIKVMHLIETRLYVCMCEKYVDDQRFWLSCLQEIERESSEGEENKYLFIQVCISGKSMAAKIHALKKEKKK